MEEDHQDAVIPSGNITPAEPVRDDARAGNVVTPPAPELPSSQKDWNGFVIPKTSASSSKRKSDAIKGTSKKRRNDSKNAPPSDLADDIMPPPRGPPPRAEVIESSDDEGSEDSDDSDDSDDGLSGRDSDLDSLFGSSSNDEGVRGSQAPPPPPHPVRVKERERVKDTYCRFDPGEGDKHTFTLNEDMTAYVTKMFTTFVADRKIKETITEEYPIPSGIPGLEVPKVDEYISDIFAAEKTDYGRSIDENWCKVQHRVLDVMGPISKLWSIMETVRTGDEDTEELDLFECLDIVEKAITLLGQAHIALPFYRKQNIVYKMTRDKKKTRTLLKQLDTSTLKSFEFLFGKQFYKKLHKSARVRKQSKEISSQLGEAKPKQPRGRGRGGGGNGGNGSQPFQTGPSPGGRGGGGRKITFTKKGRGSNRGGKYLVKVCFSKQSKYRYASRQTDSDKRTNKRTFTIKCDKRTDKRTATGKCTQGKTTRKTLRQHRPDIRTKHKRCTPSSVKSVINSHRHDTKSGGETTISHPKLANPDTGCSHPTDSEGIKDPICPESQSKQGTTTISTVSEGIHLGGLRDREHVGQGSNLSSPTSEQSVCQSTVSGPQEGQVPETSDKPEKLECPSGIPTLQDGGSPSLERVDSARGLYDKSRPEGCLLQRPGAQVPPTVPEVQVGGDKLYQFQCMPFGLGPAPRLFTKLLKPVIAFLRRLGIRIIIYLDDMIILNQCPSRLRQDRNSLLLLLTLLGFAINWKKSSLTPVQTMEFLGFNIHSVEMLISLPPDKVDRIVDKCLKLIKDRVVKVRNLAEIVGLLTSSMRAILPAPLHYRRLQMAQAKALFRGQSYETRLTLPPETLSELWWWIENIRNWNGRAIITPSPDIVIETDTSSTIGWGAVWKDHKIGGAWSSEEKLSHINVLELKGALFAVRAFAMDKRDIHIHLKMDNVSAVTYIQKMGGQGPLHSWKLPAAYGTFA